MAEQEEAIGARYRRFAREEAAGRSPLYQSLALAIAEDREMLRFLADLPPEKQQPNLFLAAVRHLQGTARDWDDFRGKFHADPQQVGAVMLERSTQTNEPARCATILPVLASIPGPLALIEVGASAGLCLLPDFYGYRYGETHILPRDTAKPFPTIACEASANTPLPRGMPDIVWRAGLDLNPLDISSTADTRWLETLVWPEQVERMARLKAAIAVARRQAPRIVRGNLLHDLDGLVAEAPASATLVICHTAVLAYVPRLEDRQAFAQDATRLGDIWISNESPRVFPEIAAQTASRPDGGQFLLSVNGRPTAWTDPHGMAIDWIGEAA